MNGQTVELGINCRRCLFPKLTNVAYNQAKRVKFGTSYLHGSFSSLERIFESPRYIEGFESKIIANQAKRVQLGTTCLLRNNGQKLWNSKAIACIAIFDV